MGKVSLSRKGVNRIVAKRKFGRISRTSKIEK